MEIIDKKLLDEVSAQAKASPRLRKNYNFHQSLYDLCHCMLNALEPGTEVPIHHHLNMDETFVILRGKIRVTTYNDDGSVAESVILSQDDGKYTQECLAYIGSSRTKQLHIRKQAGPVCAA